MPCKAVYSCEFEAFHLDSSQGCTTAKKIWEDRKITYINVNCTQELVAAVQIFGKPKYQGITNTSKCPSLLMANLSTTVAQSEH